MLRPFLTPFGGLRWHLPASPAAELQDLAHENFHMIFAYDLTQLAPENRRLLH